MYASEGVETVPNKLVDLMNTVPPPIARAFKSESVLSRLLRPVVNHLVPGGAVPVVIRFGAGQGIHLLIYPREEKYYWTGTHEIPVQEALLHVLQPGMIFWDIGAHIGFFSLIAARAVGSLGQVYSFEPMPENRDRLVASIELNDFENITLYPYALGARRETPYLYRHRSSTMWSLISERAASGENGDGILVECTTLDEISESISPPHILKIDAEGAELDVLSGGVGLLSRVKPICIVEFSNEALLNEARKLLPFYTFHCLTARHWLLR